MELVGILATASASSLISLFFFRLKPYFLLTVENSPWFVTKDVEPNRDLEMLSVLELADLLITSGAAVRVSK